MGMVTLSFDNLSARLELFHLPLSAIHPACTTPESPWRPPSTPPGASALTLTGPTSSVAGCHLEAELPGFDDELWSLIAFQLGFRKVSSEEKSTQLQFSTTTKPPFLLSSSKL